MLFDASLYYYFPYWVPSIVTASLVLFALLMLPLWGLVFTTVVFGAVATATYFFLLQPYIVNCNSRIHIGIYYGLILSVLFHFCAVLAPLTSVLFGGIVLTSFICTFYLGHLFTATKPQNVKSESQASLARSIIDSAPYEGTDEENSSVSGNFEGKRVRIMKDSFTGTVKIVRGEDGKATDVDLRTRSSGPELCCSCICDQRLLVVPDRTIATRRDVEIADESSTSSSPKRFAFARHCSFCEGCMIESDYHIEYLG